MIIQRVIIATAVSLLWVADAHTSPIVNKNPSGGKQVNAMEPSDAQVRLIEARLECKTAAQRAKTAEKALQAAFEKVVEANKQATMYREARQEASKAFLDSKLSYSQQSQLLVSTKLANSNYTFARVQSIVADLNFQAADIMCKTEKLKDSLAQLKLEKTAPKVSNFDATLPLTQVGLQGMLIQVKLRKIVSIASAVRAIVSQSELTMGERQALNWVGYEEYDHPAGQAALSIALMAAPNPTEKKFDLQPHQVALLAACIEAMINDIKELKATIENAEFVSSQWIELRPSWSRAQVKDISETMNYLALAKARCDDVDDNLTDSKLKIVDTLLEFKADKHD